MGKGNDAIPTWSGFNYQGKVMLLRVIQDMNSLIMNNKSIDGYCVELERVEDFSLLKDGKYLSIYQVKAYLSTDKTKSYEEALGKLIKHRDDVGPDNPECFLVTPNRISDWDDGGNAYSKEVKLYKYKDGKEDVSVKLELVKNYTIKELEHFIFLTGNHAINIEAVYGSLCIFLDHIVFKMHSQGHRKRDYNLSYNSIFNVIISSTTKQKEDAEYVLKERVYIHMISTLGNSMKMVCDEKCSGMDYTNCNKACAMKEAGERMLKVPDIRQYCKIINPDITEGWEDELKYVAHFAEDDVAAYITMLFYLCGDTSIVCANKNIVGIDLDAEINPVKDGIVIPSLLKLGNGVTSISNSMAKKLQMISKNKDILGEVMGNSIVVDAFDRFQGTTLKEKQITNAWNKEKDDSIKNLSDDLGFITYSGLKNYFGGKGV